MESSSDIHLVTSLRSGHMKSYEVLFERYYDRVKRFAWSLIKNEWVAEEIAQNVFMKLWVNRSTLQSDLSLSSYLFSITKNEVIDYVRQRRCFAQYCTRQNFVQQYDIQEQFDVTELQQRVAYLLEKMPSQRRKVFTMSRLDNVSNEDIARQLGISKRTVETHISAAIKQMRTYLGSLGFWVFTCLW